MKKSIHEDTVYGDTDLKALYERAERLVYTEFDKKKKGSESLQKRFCDFLKDKIEMKQSACDVSNREKRIASEKAKDEAIAVVVCKPSE